MLRKIKIHTLANDSSEEALVEVIDFIKQYPAYKKSLVPFLYHQHSFFNGRSTNETIRIRGYLMSSFEQIGLPEKALPFVLEELATSHNAYMVAAAAIAIRGLSSPRAYLAPYLIKAMNNVRTFDDAVSFDTYKPTWPLKTSTSALIEVCRTLRWMGSAAENEISHLQAFCQDDYINELVKAEIQKTIIAIRQDERVPDQSCCDHSLFNNRNSSLKKREKLLVQEVAEIQMEDQDQRQLKFREYFSGKPSIVVFFYTRCDNPNKCSLTITRLGQLQKALKSENLTNSVKTAAITYDPGFDKAFRIKAYSETRGVVFNEDNRAFRIPSAMPSIQNYFDSGVNYIGSIVNQHTVELFILDKNGIIQQSFVRSEWNIRSIITEVTDLLNDAHHGKKINPGRKLSNLFSPLFSLIIIFSPKCPICWAFYLSLLGITNVRMLQMTNWLLPIFLLLLSISLFASYRKARIRNGLMPIYISMAGMSIILLFWWLMKIHPAGYLGIALIMVGSLLNVLSHTAYMKLRMIVSMAKGKLEFHEKRVF